MQAIHIVTSLRAYILFMVISVHVVDRSDEDEDERCEAIVAIGKFHSTEAAETWLTRFKNAAALEKVEILDHWIAKKILPFERKVDFDPNIEGGRAEQVATYLHEYVPQKERFAIGQWLELMQVP